MYPERQSYCRQCPGHPDLPAFVFTGLGVFSERLKDMKTQCHANQHKKSTGHFEPKLVKRSDDAPKNLFQFACHEG